MMEKAAVRHAVLLAAGRGTRLQPYTDTTPKPLLAHKGRPTLDYILDSLLSAGVGDIVLVAHHLSEQIEQYATIRTASHRQRVRVTYQPTLAGTAHALECVIDQYPDMIAQDFVVSATDYLVPRTFFPDLLACHASHDAQLTVSMKSLDESELSTRSSIRFVDEERIIEIVEKPEPGKAPSTIGANLTFVLPPSIAPYIGEVPLSTRGEREVQYAINQWIRQGGSANGLLQVTPPEWQKPE